MHNKCNKKGDCKKEFCKKAENDNTKKCPHPKTDACKPKQDKAGGHCGFGETPKMPPGGCCK